MGQKTYLNLILKILDVTTAKVTAKIDAECIAHSLVVPGPHKKCILTSHFQNSSSLRAKIQRSVYNNMLLNITGSSAGKHPYCET